MVDHLVRALVEEIQTQGKKTKKTQDPYKHGHESHGLPGIQTEG